MSLVLFDVPHDFSRILQWSLTVFIESFVMVDEISLTSWIVSDLVEREFWTVYEEEFHAHCALLLS